MRNDQFEDQFDDNHGFWANEPTSRLEKITQRLPQVHGRQPKRRAEEWDFRVDLDEPAVTAPAPATSRTPQRRAAATGATTPAATPAHRDDDTVVLRRPLFDGEPFVVRRPTGPVRPAGSRSHGDTQSIPRVEPGAARPSDARSSDARPTAGRPGAGHPGAGHPGAGRPGARRPGVGRPALGRPLTGEAADDAAFSRPSAGGSSSGLGLALQQVDPLLRRLGTLALIVALFVPVAMAMRPDDDGAAVGPVATTPATAGEVDANGNVLPAGADAAVADGSGQAAEQVVINPEDLPPAIPVNTDPPATAEGSSVPTTVPTETAAPTAATQPARIETEQAAQCTKTYTVVGGDYWILIAKKVSVTLDELLAANKATTSTAIFPGGTVCLPANASAPTTAAPTTAARVTTAKPAPTTAAPTTTKPPTTTAPPTTTPKTNWTRAEVEAIIRATWPDDLENEAVRIATRESNLTPTAKNFCCYGLFQIYFDVHKSWLAQMGITSAQQLLDPRINAYAAVALYNRAAGWGPWKL